MTGIDNFFNYLKEKNLKYDVETVENFLLSIKAKQFVILSGSSGTGKTKLAQAYGEYISENKTGLTEITMLTSVGKSADSGNFSFKENETLLNALSGDFLKLHKKEYPIQIGNVKGKGEISFVARIMKITENKEEFLKEAKRVKESLPSESDTKIKHAPMIIGIPSETTSGCFAIVPVGANWTESRFILGYRNAITGEYVSTPSYEIISSASKNRSQMHMLVLDEMNLSHVERYFADILSAMESKEPLHIDNESESELSIGENLTIIGTVNQDETTYTFSPKVLDRANVIEINPPAIKDMFSQDSDNETPGGDVDYLQDSRNYLEIRSKSSGEIIKEFQTKAETQHMLREIQEDLSILQDYLTGIGFAFGFRTFDELMRFMYAAWIYERKGSFENWKRYFDVQILQKLLPKIHGNLSVRQSLIEIKDFCENKGYGRSCTKLTHMIDVLEKQRYVSFNC